MSKHASLVQYKDDIFSQNRVHYGGDIEMIDLEDLNPEDEGIFLPRQGDIRSIERGEVDFFNGLNHAFPSSSEDVHELGIEHLVYFYDGNEWSKLTREELYKFVKDSTFDDELKESIYEEEDEEDDDGWDEDYYSDLLYSIDELSRVAYEIRNTVRGSYAISGTEESDLWDTVEDIVKNIGR